MAKKGRIALTNDFNSNYISDSQDDLALPMHNALQGRTGIIIGQDYQKIKVIAAYTYVPNLNWGIVAKIPIKEIQKPFLKISLLTILISIILVIVSLIIFQFLSKPLIKAIFESEQKYRKSILKAPFPVIIHNKDGEILSLSKGWTDTTGYSYSDMPNISNWIELAVKNEKQKIKDDFAGLYLDNKPVDHGEYRVNCKDGSERI